MRYAIYFAPDTASPLWRFGSGVLGYDAATGAAIPPLLPPGYGAESWAAATADPRKYGFHATLKAPFELAQGRTEGELTSAMETFARTREAVPLGRCRVGTIPSSENGGFVAMMPDEPPAGLATLERAIVTELDPFRAPLTEADRARRRPERLSERQRDHLDRYGYPYIFEEFRFHMTLTGRLDAPKPVADALQAMADAGGVAKMLVLDRLALFRQDDGGSRFRIMSTVMLAGPAAPIAQA